MQRKNPKTRCTRKTIQKSKEVVHLYNRIQEVYAEMLERNDDIEEVYCNAPMDKLELGEYTSDFLCKKTDGTYMVRECVFRKYLMKPKTVTELNASRDYWRKHGVDDWGIVIDKEVADGEESIGSME